VGPTGAAPFISELNNRRCGLQAPSGSGSHTLTRAIQFEGESHKLPRATPRWD